MIVTLQKSWSFTGIKSQCDEKLKKKLSFYDHRIVTLQEPPPLPNEVSIENNVTILSEKGCNFARIKSSWNGGQLSRFIDTTWCQECFPKPQIHEKKNNKTCRQKIPNVVKYFKEKFENLKFKYDENKYIILQR